MKPMTSEFKIRKKKSDLGVHKSAKIPPQVLKMHKLPKFTTFYDRSKSKYQKNITVGRNKESLESQGKKDVSQLGKECSRRELFRKLQNIVEKRLTKNVTKRKEKKISTGKPRNPEIDEDHFIKLILRKKIDPLKKEFSDNSLFNMSTRIEKVRNRNHKTQITSPVKIQKFGISVGNRSSYKTKFLDKSLPGNFKHFSSYHSEDKKKYGRKLVKTIYGHSMQSYKHRLLQRNQMLKKQTTKEKDVYDSIKSFNGINISSSTSPKRKDQSVGCGVSENRSSNTSKSDLVSYETLPQKDESRLCFVNQMYHPTINPPPESNKDIRNDLGAILDPEPSPRPVTKPIASNKFKIKIQYKNNQDKSIEFHPFTENPEVADKSPCVSPLLYSLGYQEEQCFFT
ncbi:unnamed protein product [Moneuplotes crassus]|uniref:Uncharacterized protein n=1 Tax=Euplotes crassus TaxID=5936 RepID=A0AAD1U4J6_EUPCR|nr:unnamed protein product [Moneuplotes crassus]